MSPSAAAQGRIGEGEGCQGASAASTRSIPGLAPPANAAGAGLWRRIGFVVDPSSLSARPTADLNGSRTDAPGGPCRLIFVDFHGTDLDDPIDAEPGRSARRIRRKSTSPVYP